MLQSTKTLQKLYVVSFILLIIVSTIFTVALITTSHERKQGSFELNTLPDSIKISGNQTILQQQGAPKTEISSQDPIMPVIWNALLISIGIWMLFIVLLVLDGISNGKIRIDKQEEDEEEE